MRPSTGEAIHNDAFLTDDHIERIVQAYEQFKDEPGFTRVVTLEEIRTKDGNLSIPLYVAPVGNNRSDTRSAQATNADVSASLTDWLKSSIVVRQSLESLGITIKTG